VSYRVKPDVVAPGVNVLSSIPVAFCNGSPCWAFFQGTSMATPHLAGSAAVLRWLYPNWSAEQIRSAIVNTADQNVLKKFNSSALENNVNIIGTGRENLLSACQHGRHSRPGQRQLWRRAFRLRPVQIHRRLAQKHWLRSGDILAGHERPGYPTLAYFVSPASLTLSAGQYAPVAVALRTAKATPAGGYQALLTVSAGTNQVAHAAVYT